MLNGKIQGQSAVGLFGSFVVQPNCFFIDDANVSKKVAQVPKKVMN